MQEFLWQHNAQDSLEKKVELKGLGGDNALRGLCCAVLESNPDTTTVWFTRGNSSPENKGHSPVLERGHKRKIDSHGKVEAHK